MQVTALIVALLLGGSRMIHDAEVSPRGGYDPDPSMKVFLPLDWTGPLIGDDAGTVAHVYWDGSALVDSKGNSWTMNGTVPQVAASSSPFQPGRASSGPYSDANYYSLGAGTDVLDFAGDFSACFVFLTPNGWANIPMLFNDGSTGAATGYAFALSATGAFQTWSYGGLTGATTANTAIPYTDGALNVACGGRLGNTAAAKLNLGTYVSVAATWAQDSTNAAMVGRATAAARAYNGNVIEAWFSTTSPSDALFTAIIRRVLGQLALTVTRTSNAVFEQNSRMYMAPPGVARITSNGLLVEPTRTNNVPASESVSLWIDSGAACAITPDQGSIPGWTPNTMDLVACPGNTDTRYQVGTITSSTGPFTASSWIASDVGTKTLTIGGTGNGPAISTCTCARSDGGACTAFIGPSGQACWGYASVGTTPVRLTVTFTLSTATTTIQMLLHDGIYNTSVAGGGLFGGMQLESGSYASSYIQTPGTPLVRNADVISFPNRQRDPTHFCLRLTMSVPTFALWSGDGIEGNPYLANGWRSPVVTPAVYWQTFDSAGLVRTCQNATVLSTAATYTFRQAMVSPGSLAMSLNGVDLPCSYTGAGTAIQTAQPATVSFAGAGAYSGMSFNFKDIRLYKTGNCQ